MKKTIKYIGPAITRAGLQKMLAARDRMVVYLDLRDRTIDIGTMAHDDTSYYPWVMARTISISTVGAWQTQ